MVLARREPMNRGEHPKEDILHCLGSGLSAPSDPSDGSYFHEYGGAPGDTFDTQTAWAFNPNTNQWYPAVLTQKQEMHHSGGFDFFFQHHYPPNTFDVVSEKQTWSEGWSYDNKSTYIAYTDLSGNVTHGGQSTGQRSASGHRTMFLHDYGGRADDPDISTDETFSFASNFGSDYATGQDSFNGHWESDGLQTNQGVGIDTSFPYHVDDSAWTDSSSVPGFYYEDVFDIALNMRRAPGQTFIRSGSQRPYNPHMENYTPPKSEPYIVWGLRGVAAGCFIGAAALSIAGAGAEAAEEGLAECMEGGCFLAGTNVLSGDGTTEEPIQNIHVAQRVATDGGVANSPDGHTAASDPSATQVDPSTWKEVTISTPDGNWQVQALEPQSWIDVNHISAGGSVDLSKVADPQEMGVPGGVIGTVDSISACPTIATGNGRVVLATVSHLNSDVYNLTMSDAQGNSQTLGVTGYHNIYTDDRGWVETHNLAMGEPIRGDHGNLTVTGLARDPGAFRVYNMTIEADHDYYVGDLSALVHNGCGSYLIKFGNGMKYAGKGDYLRAVQSAQARMLANGGLNAIEWAPAVTDAQSFIAEQALIDANGGIGGGQLLNLINSPGLRLMLGL